MTSFLTSIAIFWKCSSLFENVPISLWDFEHLEKLPSLDELCVILLDAFRTD